MAIATEHSLDFVGFYLRAASRVLVVGKAVELVVALQRLGHRVLGVDDFQEVAESGFGAIVFAHALHRSRNLAADFARVDALLGARGVVLVEDFAWERVDGATAVWEATLRGEILDEKLAFARWQAENASFATGEAMECAAKERFDRVESGETPYLYRRARGDLEAAYREETNRIESGAIRAVGSRLVIH